MNEDRRVRKTKLALKQALLTLLKKKTLGAVTITELVQRADLNRSTFYHHYNNAAELFEEIRSGVLDDLARCYREPYLHVRRLFLDELSASSIQIFEHVYENGGFYTVILDSSTAYDFQLEIQSMIQKITLEELLIDAPPSLNKELYASYHAHAITGMIMDWVRRGFPETPEYMNNQLLAIIRHHPEHPEVSYTASLHRQ
ncbi:TetR/AcrR family transcriptional regulator [Alkalicoccus urumqiensis]|uniref:TetR/AcrR family transcriptional regulator n=1 Tax=Alkalicoccus urumqiensis TaxID=1548213 RepID=A0A2P6MGF9_ALKUR|nr:TetR/AcrR family transcriptional regulator [Alkalicoccus urumqiensis]PRO65357.1 TetR/AcrR family transcriptional regulator [Alkalicoccus urumqiensis]